MQPRSSRPRGTCAIRAACRSAAWAAGSMGCTLTENIWAARWWELMQTLKGLRCKGVYAQVPQHAHCRWLL